MRRRQRIDIRATDEKEERRQGSSNAFSAASLFRMLSEQSEGIRSVE